MPKLKETLQYFFSYTQNGKILIRVPQIAKSIYG